MTFIEGVTRFFQSGGFFMYPLLLILAIGTAIVAERVMILLRSRVEAKGLWRKLGPMLLSGKFDEGLKSCPSTGRGRPLHYVLSRGIQGMKTEQSREAVEGLTDEAVLEVMPRLEARLHYLPNLANVATLIGLLGTIMGLIEAFTAVAVADPAQKAALLAKGISVAMNTTAFGLVIAIPLMLIYTFLQAWTNRTIDRLDEYALKLVNLAGQVFQGGPSDTASARANRETPHSEDRPWSVGGPEVVEGVAHGQ
ncbi:MAG: MotA/TolQ/ExbB proton channel family protein [Nitrospiria bacterium]